MKPELKSPKTHTPLALLTLSLAVMLASLCASATGADLPDTARLVPPETVLLVDIGDFTALTSQFEKTSLYKLYKEPAMKPFISDFQTKAGVKIREADDELLRTLLTLDALPQGRLALGLVLNEKTKDASDPPVLFIAQWGSAKAKVEQTVEKLVERTLDDGARAKTENYRGVPVKTILRESSEIFSYCFVDDCLIGSVDLDVLKFVVAHAKGASGTSLASDPDYNAAKKATGPYHDLYLYVNIKHISKSAVAFDETDQAKKAIANLGLENVTSFGCSVALGRGPAGASSAKALLKVDGAKKGIPKILEFQSENLRTPRFIPGSAYSVGFVNLNIKAAFDELSSILYKFSPQYAALLYMPLLPPTPEGQPGVQIKTDIIDHLGSQILIAQTVKKPVSDSAAPPPTDSLIAIALTNRAALEKSLSSVHAVMTQSKPDARRELLGHAIYLIDLSALLPALIPAGKAPLQDSMQPAMPQMPKFAFSFTDTHLLLGSESGVEAAIRTLGSTAAGSLDSAPWFNKAKAAIPSAVGLAALEDSAASTEFLWKMLSAAAKQSSSEDDSSVSMGLSLSPSPGLMLSQTGMDFVDFALLPEFDRVRKYFGLSAFYGVSRPDGFFFELKEINPD
jgi:hypothetical protein